ncbi:MAG: anti-sigma regulatory factor (Ser/Thr protein kinase) [Myxococcota bacterium]|jgi:anti-sigma regulatory factor (Ser/Thr protein kinase)
MLRNRPEIDAPGTHRLSLSPVGQLDEIEQVIVQFNGFAGEHAVPDRVRRAFDIALDDLLSNIVSYAWEDGCSGTIQIDFTLTPKRLEVIIKDDGRPFDPFAMEEPDTDLALEERDIGGLGIHLVRMMMDETNYQREGDRNVVMAAKNLPAD